MDVSVVIPARDAASTLGETLGSLQAQTFPGWEAIVIDDGSTDGTAELAAGTHDPRIRVVRQPPLGVSAARNAGLALARGRWLLFLDADDLLDPAYLDRMTAALAGGADAACCGWCFVDPQGRRGPALFAPPAEDLFVPLTRSCVFAIHTCLLRRDRVEEVGGFDTGLTTCEDWDLWQRVARSGARFAQVPEVLALYRMRTGSASLVSRRLLEDGLRVIERGHGADPRVPAAVPVWAAGAPRTDLPGARLLFACWCAGLALGRGEDPLALLELLGKGRAPDLDPGTAARSLFLSVLLPLGRTPEAWTGIWPGIEGPLSRWLAALEDRTTTPVFAKRSLRALERLVAGHAETPRPWTLGHTYAVHVELEEPFRDLAVPGSADRLHVELTLRGERLGMLELPVRNGLVSREELAEAVTAEYAWVILERSLANPHPPGEGGNALFLPLSRGGKGGRWERGPGGEDSAGAPLTWSAFLQHLWNRPGWPDSHFYDPRAVREKGVPRRTAEDGRIEVEIQEELPDVEVPGRDALEARVRVGGSAAGIVTVAASSGLVRAHELRAAITLAGGFELCRALVRAQLRASPGRFRRWELPSLPDESTSGPLYGRSHFEALFAAGADPWRYTSPYEEAKYEQTLALLPPGDIPRALELACAEGHFTVRLAPRVGHLVASDISRIALERTARRCAGCDNVEYWQLDLARDPLPGRFSLIVCSEVLYYVGEGLQAVARKLAAALEPEGWLLTAHARLVADEPEGPGFDWDHPFGSKTIGEAFAAVGHLCLEREIRTPLYRVQLFRRPRPSLFPARHRPEVVEAGLPPLPPQVAAHVLWQGGAPRRASAGGPATWRLPILMYHRVAPDGSPATARWRVTPEAFEEQVRYLRDSGYHTPRLADWRRAVESKRPLPGRAVLLTFDDGCRDFAEHAWPVLRRYGFSALVFVVAGAVGGTNWWDVVYGEEVPLLGWDEVRHLRSEGVEIGSHSATHRPLTALTPCEVEREATRSLEILSEALGELVEAFAYPYGDTDPAVRRLVESCGYTYGLSTRPGRCRFEDPLLDLPRIEVVGGDSFERFVARLEAVS
ncbi:MAG TPA: trifunctional glycosyltransferase/class I SAM-dependent methyltransferase/polysaccharide deacetylase [Thermoanaerobaculia bacterium]|nr:trifunctional glycosyltransferase/class I SAM-dependent methyltransferase/polysaccharide deacetylase [Thermoanaerobaculia bacterium]